MSANPFLITPVELGSHLGRSGLSIVDASWYLPTQNRFARPEFEAAHIPGAVFFDQDAVVNPSSSLPHALPDTETFARAVGGLGITQTDTIVVYDGVGLFTAPRVWWMFRTFGAKDVRVLDGGFPAWTKAGLPVETGQTRLKPATFQATLDPDAIVTLNEMRSVVATGGRQIADARPGERFQGDVPEPREGLRAGNIPGSRSVPVGTLSEDGRLKSPEALRALFMDAGVDPDAPVVTTCGSGVTAAAINFALASLNNRNVKLYDGSWTEWGSSADAPIETGSAR